MTEVTDVTAVTDVTTHVADQVRRHARHAVTSQNFLINRLGRAARLCERTHASGRGAGAHRSKPLIRRHIDGESPAGNDGVRVVGVSAARSSAQYTLDFWPRKQGVGLAFVSQRGYGRRRWLVLYRPRQKKMTAMRRRNPWPFPS